jgi:protease-4
MTDRKRGIIAGFFLGFWNLLNFTRRLVVNVIFLFLVALFLIALRSSGTKLGDRSALVLDPKGSIVEQYTTEPVQRAFAGVLGDKAKQVQLRDILRAIDSAAADKRIERIVLKPDDIESAGLSTLREIGAALERFKASGKQVIAVSDGMDQRQYYLAAHANQILLHPDSLEGVLLSGFGAYRSYFKEALDWLGVDVHLFRVGEYKSYAEPYIRNDQSPEAREADLYWMNGLWNGYLKDVAAARHLDAQNLSALIDHFADAVKGANGDMAKLALANKLVDQLATPDEARELLIAAGVKQGHSYRHIDFQDYATLTERESALDVRPRIAVVVAEGEILSGEQPPGTVGGESTAKLLRQAREDEKNKAIVLRVNSPGGDAFASELIRREVELTKAAHKPLLVSMGDVAASGGYWISMDADKIYAQPTTITGSIGIFGLMLNIPNTLAKIGVHTDGVGTTPIADALDPRRPLDPKVGDVIQSMIDKGYQDFIGRVSVARHKDKAQIDAIARGRVWSGEQALERGLVDELGGLGDALTAAAQEANLGTNFRVHYVEKPLSAWERFALNFSNDALAHYAKTLLPEMPAGLLVQPEIRSQLRLLQGLGRGKPGVFAYCFCDLR